MTRVPDVSVVISTFDRGDRLVRALDGLLRLQDVPPGLEYEVIVVDNNSTDTTRAIVAEYLSTEPRLRYVFEARQGVSYGRNAGIAAARAPVVAFTDDDNQAAPDWIRSIKALLDQHPDVAGVGGRILPEWPSAVPPWLDRRHWSPLAILDYGDRPFYSSREDPRCLLTANLALRRTVLDRIGGFSPEFPRCQDHELLLRLWRAGERVLYAPDVVVHTRIAPERLTKRYHRDWYATHGFYSASMRLLEIVDADGRLRDESAGAIQLYGVPGYVYRDWSRQVRLWAGAVARLDFSGAFASRQRMRYIAAYIRRRMSTAAAPRPRVPELMAFVAAHVKKAGAATGVPPRSIIMVHALLAVLAGGSLYDIVTNREHWPLSPYPMFATAERTPSLRALRVLGVTSEAVPREIPLRDRRLIEPFDQCRLTTAFERTYNNLQRRPMTPIMLHDVLTRYESLRVAGEHDGPPLAAARLYEMTWTLDPHAANVDRPDTRRLLAEVRLERSTSRGSRAAR